MPAQVDTGESENEKQLQPPSGGFFIAIQKQKALAHERRGLFYFQS